MQVKEGYGSQFTVNINWFSHFTVTIILVSQITGIINNFIYIYIYIQGRSQEKNDVQGKFTKQCPSGAAANGLVGFWGMLPPRHFWKLDRKSWLLAQSGGFKEQE
jgi:hypothetical protein